ncbi:hypothetical protein C8J57DRAFT_1434140 [Mycena rebaudengoi]|nr:hypothetical protein C8J57DRAFT_1434140 [Mycena rebaudengoi]
MVQTVQLYQRHPMNLLAPEKKDVRYQVAFEVAVRTINKAETCVKLGVGLTFSKSDDDGFLRTRRGCAASTNFYSNTMSVFVVATTGQSTRTHPNANTLVICGSPEDYVQRAVLLASSKFMGRIDMAKNDGDVWVAVVRDIGASPYDEQALWDVVRKAARAPMDPLVPPPGSRGIDQSPRFGAPTFLVDIRPAEQREREGGIHGSLIIERNVLEWRFDPRSVDRLIIGYTSSLAAFALQELGLLNATDIIGGYQAWMAAGLPVDISASTDGAPSVINIVE